MGTQSLTNMQNGPNRPPHSLIDHGKRKACTNDRIGHPTVESTMGTNAKSQRVGKQTCCKLFPLL
eukprot:693084-Amphidinium_carterae.3